MNTLYGITEKYFIPIAGKISEQRHLKAIRDGIISVMPLLIIGSVFLIISSPPIESWAKFMEQYATTLNIPVNATFGILGLVAVFTISYSLSKSYEMDGLSAGVIGLAAFMVAAPLTEEGNIPLDLMGAEGLFIAIVLAIFSVEIYKLFETKNIIIKMPSSVPSSVWRAFTALLPGLFVILIIWSIDVLLSKYFHLSLHDIIGTVLKGPLELIGSSLWGALIAVLLIHLLWALGLHGESIVASVLAPIWYGLTEANVTAHQAGQELPHIVGQPLMAIWFAVGGSGMAFALAVIFIWRAKSKHLRNLGKVSIWSSFFNISEPIMFGAPVVLNPLIFIPFIVVPIVVTITTYFAMSFGLVGKPYVIVPWTTPPPFSGILTTGDWRGGILMLVNLLVAILIYYPFVRLYDRQLLNDEKNEETLAK